MPVPGTSCIINAAIPEISSKKMSEIETVWLPMFVEQAISLETLLNQLATVDVDVELERLKDEAIHQSRNSGDARNGNTGNGSSGNARQNQGNRPTS